MVLAVAKLEQPVFRDAPIAASGGAVQAHALGLPVVYTQPMLVQGALKSGPAGIVTHGCQHPRQAVVAEVQWVDSLPGAAAQGVEPLLGPGLDMAQPMIGLREDRGQPDHQYPAQAEAYPVAMGRKVLVIWLT